MNHFGILVAVLQGAAAIQCGWRGEWNGMIVYCAFAVASAAIAWRG